jgi:imidazolonepropionase-like amidohydrolase
LDKAKSLTKRHRVSFKNALRGGLQIAMGTDAGTPFNFHGENAQELERMVALGMSPMQAILSSTSDAARLIGIQDQVGTVEKGKLADLLLFKGNPLRHIDLLRDRSRIIGVMQAGKFVAGPLSRT